MEATELPPHFQGGPGQRARFWPQCISHRSRGNTGMHPWPAPKACYNGERPDPRTPVWPYRSNREDLVKTVLHPCAHTHTHTHRRALAARPSQGSARQSVPPVRQLAHRPMQAFLYNMVLLLYTHTHTHTSQFEPDIECVGRHNTHTTRPLSVFRSVPSAFHLQITPGVQHDTGVNGPPPAGGHCGIWANVP